MRIRLVGLVLALAITVFPARSQNVTSTIVGNVRDSSGASIPGAAVIVTNEGTGIETKTKTGADGEYTVAGLPFGQYTVRMEATGFRENLVKGITLLPNRTTRQDFTANMGKEMNARACPAKVAPEEGQRGAAEYIKLADGILRIVGQLPERNITPDKLTF